MAPAVTVDISRWPAFAADDLWLWNWTAAFLPGGGDCQAWLQRAAAELLREPVIARAHLVLTTGNEPAQTIAIDPARTLTLGRAPENDIVLPQATVTRQHAELHWQGDTLWLTDLGSSLGTVVNGVKAQANLPLELADGTEFVIFPYRFQLKLARDWAPVKDVALTESRRSVTEEDAFLAEHDRGWTRFALRMAASSRALHVALDSSLLDALAAKLLAPLEGAAFVLPGSKLAWHELLLLGAMAEANQGLPAPAVLSLTRAHAGTGKGLACEAVLELNGLNGTVACYLPADLLTDLAAQLTVPAQTTLAAVAPLDFPLAAGRIELTLAEQKGLEPGDVVLYRAAPALLYPGNDRLGWHLRLAGENQFCLERKFQRNTPMTDTLTELSDLTLTVEIILGHKRLTLGQAHTLAPNAVLDLAREPNDAVHLAVNGQVLGTGQLVTVDGRLGVRIVEWAGGRA